MPKSWHGKRQINPALNQAGFSLPWEPSRRPTHAIAMQPESTTPTPAFTPARRTISLANHWIATGRSQNIIPVVQLLLESNSPKLLIEARDMLDLLVGSQA